MIVDLSNWKKKKDILVEAAANGVPMDERAWRLYVEKHNMRYWIHEEDEYIVHSNKGYKLTSDKQEIRESIEDNKKRGLNLLWKHSQTMKALGEVDNLRMDLEELELI